MVRWARALLGRYMALYHHGVAAQGGGLSVELQRWLNGDGALPERIARGRAADIEVQAYHQAARQWPNHGPSARWHRLLHSVVGNELERDLVALLIAMDLSPRTAATVRLLSGWSDAAGIERSFAQSVLDPFEEHAQQVADVLRSDHPLAVLGVVRGLQARGEYRVQFLDLAPVALTWLGHGADAACRGRDHLGWFSSHQQENLWQWPLVRADIDRAVQALAPSQLRLRLRAGTPDDALLWARGVAARTSSGLVAYDGHTALRRQAGEAAWLDSDALLDGLRAAGLLAVLENAPLLVRGLGQDDGGRALDLTAIVRLLQPLPVPVFIEDAAAETASVATTLGRELNCTALEATFPDLAQRRQLWTLGLRPLELAQLPAADLLRLAAFPLTAAQIAAVHLQRRQTPTGMADLEATTEACRERVGHRVGDVAQRVTTAAAWDQVVLPDPVTSVVKEIIAFAKHGELVLQDWGFAARYHYGLGLTSLFSGPPGTGKTMLAGIIARELGLDLYRIDLSRVLSKYIGETEQRLGRLFEEGRRGGVALLFDEADSLFARRTEVKSSVDRYANLEVNFLLQKMEEYTGVVILTTNFADSIDEAFKRRIRFHAQFPLPNELERTQLWMAMIPPKLPIVADLPFELLAKAYEFSGGEIKNAVLRAAFYAAVDAVPVSLELLDRAAQAECAERGRLVLRTAVSLNW
ncbi:MAG: ATP-binding protein [Myxococcales bacterium]|nr:ATP-binding protein [Myxococcales bacterium]